MGEGNAKTKSYCPKHRGYKKRVGLLINTGENNHREIRGCEGV